MVDLHFFSDKDFNQTLIKLKEDFDKKWADDTPSTSDRLSEFTFMKILGQGAFGVVKLVKHEETSKYYAMKILPKSKIIRSKQVEHTKNEKKLLKTLNFPFLVNLDFSFKDNSYLYLAMPFVNGGEMFTHLRKAKKFDENLTCFYGAQILLALEYLHFLNLIYRDLKPENIMVDSQGYLRLTDFGFCKLVVERTYTLCGTPEYLAPEIIQSKGYGKSVDWWSFGVLLFEMAHGSSPFYTSRDQMVLLDKIVSGKFKMPSHFSNNLKNLVQNILQVDLTRRYGNLKNGVNDIKYHSWFKKTNWIQLLNKETKPPFAPNVSDEGDTSQFDFYEDIKMDVSDKCKYEREFADF